MSITLKDVIIELIKIDAYDNYLKNYDWFVELGNTPKNAKYKAQRAYDEEVELRIEEERKKMRRLKIIEGRAKADRMAEKIRARALARLEQQDPRGKELGSALDELSAKLGQMGI